MSDAHLQAFTVSLTSDPLFAAEGMDLKRGGEALSAIEAMCAEFQAVAGRYSFAYRAFFLRYPLERYALPLSFIVRLIRSEHLRRAYLEEPSREAAQALVREWHEAQRALARDASRYRELHTVLHRLNKKNGDPSGVEDVFGAVTTPEDAFALLDALEKNARTLATDIAAREALLRSGTPLPPARKRAALRYETAEIPPRYARARELELRDGFPFRGSTILEMLGPVGYTTPIFDGTPTRHVFDLAILRDNASGLHHAKVSTLDVYTFMKIGQAAGRYNIAGQVAFQSLINRNVPYWYQCATNPYTARDQRYWADIATIVDLERRPQLNSALVQAQRSSMLDLLLGACWEDHTIYLKHMKERIALGTTLPYPWHWLLKRSHPSLYYLPFNASIWRLAEEPDFGALKPRIPLSQWAHRPADEVLPTLTDEQLQLVMKSGRIREEDRKAAWDAYTGAQKQ